MVPFGNFLNDFINEEAQKQENKTFQDALINIEDQLTLDLNEKDMILFGGIDLELKQ